MDVQFFEDDSNQKKDVSVIFNANLKQRTLFQKLVACKSIYKITNKRKTPKI